ncbi:MAG: hypothetical protein MJ138_05760 [Kiritimatiellae bacterium]|nr:hypothetical protein [Kiritimatiellia bacterium]
MKIYIVKHPKTKHTGLSAHEKKDFVFSVETEHPDDAIKGVISFAPFLVFEEGDTVFIDALPNSILSIVRDFIWDEFREQGIVEEGNVTPL